jgi:hypothetical protein
MRHLRSVDQLRMESQIASPSKHPPRNLPRIVADQKAFVRLPVAEDTQTCAF